MAELYSASGDVRLTEDIAGEYILALGDRESLFGHPNITYGGTFAASGSLTRKFPIVSAMGIDRMAAVAENAATTPTDLGKSSTTITGSRQALERGQSDVNEMVDGVGFNISLLVMDGLGAYVMRWQEMLCETADFTDSVGSTTVNNDIDDVFSAKATLINNSVGGLLLGTVYPHQYNQIVASARSETGAFQYREDVQAIFNAGASMGFKGNFLGIDWFTSTLVPTINAGADSRGSIVGPGAIGYMDGSPRHIQYANGAIIQQGQAIWTEFGRDASGAITKVVHNSVLGFGVLEQRGVDFMGRRTT